MASTSLFVMTCVVFVVNGYGIQVDKPVCDGQQLACSYCTETLAFVKSVVDDANTESAVTTFMLTICDFINSSSPGRNACTDHVQQFPKQVRLLLDAIMSDPEKLCGFVCSYVGPVNDKCVRKPLSDVAYPVASHTGNTMVCEVCKSVPLLLQQILTGNGFLGGVEKFLLTDCDLIAPGAVKDRCIEHTYGVSMKIKLFAAEALNPDTGCAFVCSA